jgi:sugar lactone lactonase YvrE
MLRTLTTRVALVLAVTVTAAPTARAADRTILGSQLVVKNPSTPERRKVVAKAKEVGSPDPIVGNPTTAGATLSVAVNGNTPSAQTFTLPGGTSALTGKPFWSGDAVRGFKYKDSRGENGPVKVAQLKKSGGGTFQLKAVAAGKLGAIDVVPPNPGTDGCVRFEVGGGGGTYHVRFGVDGQGTNDGAKLFKVVRPTVEGTCPPPTTTTTTIPPQSCTFVLKWGVPAGTLNGELIGPSGVATDGSGNVYVADTDNNRIQKFDASGAFLTTWGSAGSDTGQFNFGQYPFYPNGVATDGSGNVYIADTGNHRIQKFDANGVFLTGWGGFGSGNGQFILPPGVATDGSGNVYVADYYNQRIQKFDAGGTFLTSWSTGVPISVATDGSGNVYVAGADGIGKFDASGSFLTGWSTGNSPFGVATDGSGNVYVAGGGGSRIQKFDASGTFLATWGSGGSGNGQFSSPVGVATDGSGNVYVADSGNDRIQKFDTSGTFLTSWDSHPLDVATDGSGNLYVTIVLDDAIRKFDTSGTFLTIWGSSGSGNGQFAGPTGMATDGSGNVYVADTGNHRIQKFACP